jgi:beta,beta-carotene 9',10'-dioxygenase
MPTPFAAGFDSVTADQRHDLLPLSGSLPSWLRGALYRNGPSQWQVGETSLAHWFDGFARLHRFDFRDDGTVSYLSRMLDSEQYRRSTAQGRLWRRVFATDPVRRWYHKVAQLLWPAYGDNALVNILPYAGGLAALTESPRQVLVDPLTLGKRGEVAFADDLRGDHTSAHPLTDPATGEVITLLTKYGKVTRHQFTRLAPGARRRDLLGVITAAEPSYHHTFGLSRRFIVLTEWPFVVQPLRIVLGDSTILGSYRWKPELGLRIRLLERASGRVLGPFTSDACFGFHHVNAYDDGDALVFDVAVDDGPQVFEELLLERLRDHGSASFPRLRRFRVDLAAGRATHQPLGEGAFDFPVIDERFRSTPPAAVFGCGVADARPEGMLNQIVRRTLPAGTQRVWRLDGCYPGEPVFVPRPGGSRDEGVLLSVVLDAGRGHSFLAVLDATTLEQLARIDLPQVVPFGFHGSFVAA